MNRNLLDSIASTVEELINPMGFECVDVEWDAGDETLRVFIDKVDGVRMDDCVVANEALVESEELDKLVGKAFRLEVSSPGLDRPLRKRDHFSSHIGQIIRVRLSAKMQGRVEGSGKLVGIDPEDVVSLELPTGSWDFPRHSIQKANLVYQW